jgi:hypothetical protein
MNHVKRKKIKKKGFHVGTVQAFLKLSPKESAIIEKKVAVNKIIHRCGDHKTPG